MIEYLIDKIEDFKHIETKQSGFLNKVNVLKQVRQGIWLLVFLP